MPSWSTPINYNGEFYGRIAWVECRPPSTRSHASMPPDIQYHPTRFRSGEADRFDGGRSQRTKTEQLDCEREPTIPDHSILPRPARPPNTAGRRDGFGLFWTLSRRSKALFNALIVVFSTYIGVKISENWGENELEIPFSWHVIDEYVCCLFSLFLPWNVLFGAFCVVRVASYFHEIIAKTERKNRQNIIQKYEK
jgi:hypothetical protein